MREFILLPLDRYKALMQPPGPEVQSSSSDVSIQQHAEPSISNHDQIIEILPKRAKQKATSILQLVKDHLTWNSRGEVTIKGQFIPGSHICDLLKFVVFNTVTRKKFPIGHKEFGSLLQQLNIPKSLVYGLAEENTIASSTWCSI